MIITIATHNGRFHADDVFGVAVLRLVYAKEGKQIKIVRTRDKAEIQSADVVLDVGGEFDASLLRFDHHQGNMSPRDNGVPYAAFGLVWRHFGDKITTSEIVSKLDADLVQVVDAGDCGFALFSSNISDVEPINYDSLFRTLYRPDWDGESEEAWYDGFIKAVDLAEQILTREIHLAEKSKEAEMLLVEAYHKSTDKRVVVLDRKLPIMDSQNLTEMWENSYYIISPQLDGTYGVLALRKCGEKFGSKLPFPPEWRGLVDESLSKVSGVSGSVFCHLSGFYAVNKTLEGAKAMAELSLKQLDI
jgi:uncharacterized UPF0160 family protein